MSDLLESLQKASDNVPFTNVAITPVSHLYWGMYDTCITKGEGDSCSTGVYDTCITERGGALM